MAAKESTPKNVNVTQTSGLVGKTISTINAHQYGTVTVIQVATSDGSSVFIKHQQGRVEVGGTTEMGTGTVVLS